MVFFFTEKFLKKFCNGAILDAVLSLATLKNNKELNKSDYKPSDKTKVEKLEDATAAGSKESDKCTLILTEGDSAKALVSHKNFPLLLAI